MMLEVKGLHTFYGPSHILHGVDLSLQSGEAISLVGRNGAGKTTLMRSIIQLTRPSQGTVTFSGTNLARLKPHEICKLGIKLVPQGRRVFPKLTVEENLQLALMGQKVESASAELKRAYERFEVLGRKKNQKVRGLSGGERQMLAIVRALVGTTNLLLMDEPTEGLAPIIVREVHDFILELKQTGLAILLAEQNVKMALSACDRHYILEKGEMRFSGTTDELAIHDDVLIQALGVTSKS